MRPKRVQRFPLEAVIGPDGAIVGELRLRDLDRDDLADLLRNGPVCFVVADVGLPPIWVPLAECFDFWKREVKPHLAEGDVIRLDDFPGGYCYLASQWRSGLDHPIVALEKLH